MISGVAAINTSFIMWTAENLKIVCNFVRAIRITSGCPFNLILAGACSQSLSCKLKAFIIDLGLSRFMKLAARDIKQLGEARDKDKPGRDRKRKQCVEAGPSGTEATGKCAGFPSGT